MVRKNMESRKVQKTGLSTITVSLPKDWVSSNNLKAGDQVNLEVMPDGSLNIDPKERRRDEPQRKTINVERDEAADHLVRKLIGAYLAGFTIIEARSKERMDLDTKHAVKEFARLVIGPEVIEETANTIVLHDLSDPVELPQKKCVRRMHIIVDSMHRDAMIAYAEKDKELAKDVINRDQDVDRLYWMTFKQFNLIQKDRSLAEKVGVNIYESMSLMLVARMMERIGDHAEKIAKNAIAQVDGKGAERELGALGKLSHEALEVLNKAVESFFLRDISGANDIIDRAEELARQAEVLFPDMPSHTSKGAVTMTSVLDSVVRTIMYSMDIAELAINEAMREQ
ncbi:MAG: phosphate uptake regulator PhoU [Methanomassiliicoccales archaeon]|nr:phosphate uptake regulator PhoU [Methanomassiliicoccales archaeon]